MTPLPRTGDLALQLMQIPSPSGMELDALLALEQLARRAGLAVARVPVDATRYDLLLSWGPRPTRVLLSSHVDTVPGGPRPELRGDELVGRGACDAKGCLAAMLGALHDLGARGVDGVGLLVVVGEETSSDGARAAARQLPPVAFVVNGEPTQLRFVSAQRGVLSLRCSAEGVTAHSGYPALGRSAVHALLDALQRLRAERWPSDPTFGETSLNVGLISGGSAANVLAERAEAQVMIRISTDLTQVEARALAALGPEVRGEVVTRSEPQRLHVPPGREAVIVGFGSDVPHLRSLGTPLMVGPGSIHDAHTDHERVEISELERARQLYCELCLQLLEETP